MSKTAEERARETVTIIRGVSHPDSPDYEQDMTGHIKHAIEVAVNEEVVKHLVAYCDGRDQEVLAARQALELVIRTGCTLCREGNRPKKHPVEGGDCWLHTLIPGPTARQCGCPAYLHNLLDRDDDALFMLVKEPVTADFP